MDKDEEGLSELRDYPMDKDEEGLCELRYYPMDKDEEGLNELRYYPMDKDEVGLNELRDYPMDKDKEGLSELRDYPNGFLVPVSALILDSKGVEGRSDGKLSFSEEERGKIWIDYMERIIIEEND